MRTRTLVAAFAAMPLLTGLGFAFVPRDAALSSPAAPPTAAVSFRVDPVHSHVLFRTKHMGVSYAHGRFNAFEGKFTLGESPSIQLTIDTSSVDTQSEKRDGHLAGPDFFDSGQFPRAKFKSTKIEDKGDGKYAVTGDLELRGKSKEIRFEAIKVGEGAGPRDSYLAGLHAGFTIQRSDFGINYGIENGGVADDVLLEISLEGIRE